MNRFLALAVLALTLSGCSTLEVGVAGTTTPASPSVTSTAASTATPPATASPTVAPTAIPNPLMSSTPPAGLIYRTDDGLWRIDDSGESVPVFDQPDGQLSPDGRHVLYPSGQTLWLADRHTDERRSLIAAEDRFSCCAAWWPARPDQVIVSSWPRGLERGMGGDLLVGFLTAVDIGSGDYRVLDAERDTFGTAAPSPDGRRIAYGAGRVGWFYNWNDDRIEVFDPGDYTLPDEFEVTGVSQPAWSPDSDSIAWLLSGQQDGTSVLAVGVFDMATEEGTLLHPYTPIGTDGTPPAPRFSPDGRWIAFVTWDQNEPQAGAWVASIDGQDEHQLASGAQFTTDPPSWSPDSTHLLVTGSDGSTNTSWVVAVDSWERQQLEMPADDARVVEYRPEFR